MKTVAIAGATGLVGNHLLNLLIMNPSIQTIHVLGRRKTDAISSKVVEHIVDFNDLCETEISETIDIAYCCLGTTIKDAGSKEAFQMVDYKYVIAFSEWAHKRECEIFSVVSSTGANPNSTTFYLRTKGIMEESLIKMDFKNLSIFRPSMLLGKRKHTRPLEIISTPIIFLLSPFLLGKLKKYRAIKANDVAHAILQDSLFPSSSIHIFESNQISECISKH